MKLKLARSIAAVAVLGWIGQSDPARAVAFNDVFIFGDSYSDTGAYVPLTNGSTAAGYLAQDLGVTLTTSKNPTPGTDGVNFAESGARIGLSGTSVQPRSLLTQVAEFQNYVTTGALTFNPSTSLFFLSGGLNDHTSPISEIISDYTTEVNTLYSLGARYFEIALIPSLVPAFSDSAARLNPVFSALVPSLQTSLPSASITLSNWGPFYDDILTNPSKYGITNTTDPCSVGFPPTSVCPNPDQYFYYIIVHPSDASHHFVGNELYQEALAIQPVPEPASLVVLGGMAITAVIARKKRRGRA